MKNKIYIKLLWIIIMLTNSNIYADIGSVTATSDSNSFNVTWGWSPNNYRPASNTDYIKVCYKKKNRLKRICKNKEYITTNSPFKISGLEFDQKYKIKVFCKCQKKKKRGNGWKKAKWHEVSTLIQSTAQQSFNSDDYSGVLSITGSDLGSHTASMSINFSAGNTIGSDLVRVCFKKRRALHNMKNHCKTRDSSYKWNGKGNRLGMIENKTGGSFNHTFNTLNSGQDYKFMAFVFPEGGDIGKHVDTAIGHTPKKQFKVRQSATLQKKNFNSGVKSQSINTKKINKNIPIVK